MGGGISKMRREGCRKNGGGSLNGGPQMGGTHKWGVPPKLPQIGGEGELGGVLKMKGPVIGEGVFRMGGGGILKMGRGVLKMRGEGGP